jgi:hypothetical protein
MTSKVRKRTSRDTKNENERRKYLIQLDVVFKKKTMAKVVEYQDIKQHTVTKSWNIVILYVIQLSDRVYNVMKMKDANI